MRLSDCLGTADNFTVSDRADKARIVELEAEVERLREELDTAVCRVCLQRLVREAEATSPSDDWRRDLAEM